jgi:heme/copper-type cytochrome/quinol oxidase subunit 2
VCKCLINHKLCGSKHALMRKTVRLELASFQQTHHATDLYQIRSS